MLSEYQKQQSLISNTIQAKAQKGKREMKSNPKSIIRDKRIHSIIADIQRYDPKKLVIPKLQKRHKIDEVADLSKL